MLIYYTFACVVGLNLVLIVYVGIKIYMSIFRILGSLTDNTASSYNHRTQGDVYSVQFYGPKYDLDAPSWDCCPSHLLDPV